MVQIARRAVPTLLAGVAAGALCWAGLTFEGRRSVPAAWPTVEGDTFPRTVRLPDGGTFTLTRAPRRIVLASATVVDLATALVGPERVAGLCSLAFVASALTLAPEPWRAIPTHDHFTAEAVLAVQPDLVLCNDYNDQGTAAALRRAGVPVLVLPGPANLADCTRSLALLGAVLGVEDRAFALERDLDRRVRALRDAAPPPPRKRALCFTCNPTGSYTGGPGTLHHEALVLAGFANAAAEAGIEGHAPISVEQIGALDPDLLVVDAPPDGGRGSLAFLRENPILSRLRALTTGAVVELPQALYATGSHHVVAAAEAIAAGVRRAERAR